MLQPLQIGIARLLFAFCLVLALTAPAFGTEKPSSPPFKFQNNHLRLSFESVDMPSPDDRMGLLGFSYLTELNSSWSLGISGYGSVSGDRGGFFTGGFSGGFKQRLIEDLWLDTGLFAGGGGGGGAAQGGGLMLRAHAGLIYDFDSFSIGAAFSSIDFPNGDIESQHLALTLDIPFTTVWADQTTADSPLTAANVSKFIEKSLQVVHQELLLKSRVYLFSDSTRTTSGMTRKDNLKLLGVEYRRFFSKQSFLLAETMGAFAGEADGYAEVMFGAGHRQPMFEQKFNLLASLAAGAAGGGRIDTGGGAVIRAEIDLEYQLKPGTVAALGSGYFEAVDGNASGWILGIKVGSSFETIRAGSGPVPVPTNQKIQRARWRLRGSHQSYFHPERKGQAFTDRDVHLAGVKIDHFIKKNLYLSGQATGAYNGDAGGYAVGLIGLGWQGKFGRSNWHPVAELMTGAGGGGGIDVGEGALIQPLMGIEYSFNDRYSLQVMAGQILAVDGDLNSTTAEVSLCYRFSNLVLSPK